MYLSPRRLLRVRSGPRCFRLPLIYFFFCDGVQVGIGDFSAQVHIPTLHTQTDCWNQVPRHDIFRMFHIVHYIRIGHVKVGELTTELLYNTLMKTIRPCKANTLIDNDIHTGHIPQTHSIRHHVPIFSQAHIPPPIGKFHNRFVLCRKLAEGDNASPKSYKHNKDRYSLNPHFILLRQDGQSLHRPSDNCWCHEMSNVQT